MTAREAFLIALADQFGLDLTDPLVAQIDCVLARLWMHGFKIVPWQS
jgi:hypothetical protein